MRRALALLLILAGCPNKEPPPPPKVDAAVAVTDAGDAAAAVILDPVTAAVHKAAACKGAAPCLDAALGDKVFDEGGGTSILVGLLEDKDAGVREAAAIRLDRHQGKGYATDKALAEKMIAVAEKPRAGGIVTLTHLGLAIGRIKVRPTDTWIRVRGLTEKGPAALRRSILSTLLDANAGDEDITKAVRSRLHDVDPSVRVAAASALDKTPEGSCKLLAEDLKSADDSDVGRASQAIALDMSRCPAHHAPALAALERVHGTGKIKSVEITEALVVFLSHKDEAIKTRAATLGRTMVVDNRVPGAVRRVLIAPLLAVDAKAMAPIMEKLAKDKDPAIIGTLANLDGGAPEAGAPDGG
jgi:hypothetical protein